MPSVDPTEENKRRGAALKSMRLRQGLTQRQAAMRADMADETYAQREQGRIAINPIEVPGLAEALGVASDVLAREIEAATAAKRDQMAEYPQGRPPGRVIHESPAPSPQLRSALAGMVPGGLVEPIADVLVAFASLPAPDQQAALDAIQDLLVGRTTRARNRSPRRPSRH